MSTATLPGVIPVAGRDADAPPLAGDTDRGRFYRLTPGGPLVYPSITTVKHERANDVLERWKIKMAAQRAGEWLTWLASIPADRRDDALGQVTSRIGMARWMNKVRAASQDISLARAERGSLVHLAIEQMLTGRPVEAPAEYAPVAAFKQFMADLQIVPVEVELTVVNHTHRYAGTADLLGRIGPDGPLVIVDWKARNNLWPDTSLQLAALANAEFILRPDGTQEPFPEVAYGIGVALGDDARYRAHALDIGEVAFGAFCAARTLFDFDPTLGTRVRSAEGLLAV